MNEDSPNSTDGVGRLRADVRSRALLEHSPIAIMIADLQGNIVTVNNSWIKLWDLSPEQVTDLKATYNILTDPELESQGVKNKVEKAFRGEHVSTPVIFYGASNEGENGRWVEVHLTPVKDENDQLLELILVFRDVTAQKEAEKNENAKKEQLQAVISNSPAVVYLKGVDGKYQLVNDEFERIFKKKRADVIGKTDFELLPQEVASLYVEMDKKVVEQGKAIKQEETAPLDDGVHTYLSIKFPIRDENGVIYAVGGVSTDITDQKKGEDEKSILLIREKSAIESSRLKSEFLANMSHEIRTPINGVIGMTSLLLDSSLSPDQQEYTEAIRRSGQSLLTIVNDILDLSKIEAGRVDLELIAFSMRGILDDIEKIYLPIANGKSLQITTKTDEALHPLHMGDASRIRQVVNNFVDNAVKFTHSGTVSVQATLESSAADIDDISIRVQDSGIGISKEAEGRLFEPFSQADGSMSRKYGGTGLGLSIARKLALLMGGAVGFKRTPSGGSEFWLKLPLKRGIGRQPTSRSQRSADLITFSDRNVRVLVAEDNKVNQVITLKMLQKMGLSADVVANGKEVIDALNNMKYDLILMDCQMPEMDGYDATRKIRHSEEERLSKLPILALTAGAMQSDQDKCYESGMDDVITKPVRPEFLAAKIQHWLRKHAA